MFHYPSRRKSYTFMIILASVALVIAAIVVDFSNPLRKQPWSGLSIGMASIGLVSGVTSYLFNRMED